MSLHKNFFVKYCDLINPTMLFMIFVIIITIVLLSILSVMYTWYRDGQIQLNSNTVEVDYFVFCDKSDKITVNKIKQSLIVDKVLEASELEIINDYSFNNEPPHVTFTDWQTKDTVFIKLCKFGICLLTHYIKFKTPDQYLYIVTNILKRLTAKDDTGKSMYVNQWKIWSTNISPLLKLMVMYEYIVNDNLRKKVCHDLMIEMVPKLDQLFDSTIEDEKVIYIGVPRLLTNFVFDRLAYTNDTNGNELKKLDKYFNIEYTKSDVIQAGLYMDGSCISNNNNRLVAQYSSLLPYVKERDDFYDKMYAALGFKVNYRNRVENVLQKLLHPSIKYHIVGLFDNHTNKMENPDWWKVQPIAEGVHIFPFIGVGVFKTPNLLFVIQLQQIKNKFPSNNKLTLGLMQLRKIYKSDDIKNKEFTEWSQVMRELGVIHIAKDDNTKDEYKCEPQEFYIGHLVDEDLLFWYNRYHISDPYTCMITEIGVMTKGGLISKYKIINNDVDVHQLVFNNVENRSLQNERAIMNGNNRFDLNIIIDANKIASNVDFKERSLMVFEYKSQSYEVISIDNKHSFLVKCDSKIILGGSANSDPSDIMVYNNQILKRTSSLMYMPHQ